MNPNALDRTAAWLLNMNVQYLEQEGIDPDSKHREDFPNKEDLTPTEKVIMRPHPAGRQQKTAVYAEIHQAYCLCDQKLASHGHTDRKHLQRMMMSYKIH